jgi:hypothetical protein
MQKKPLAEQVNILNAADRLASIAQIAHNRVTQPGHMNPELMGATRLGHQPHSCYSISMF